MNHKIQFLWVLMIACLWSSCRDEEFGTNGTGFKTPITLSGEIDQLYVSRVNDNGFADGDIMGVYIVDYEGSNPGTLQNSGNRGTNVKHTFDEESYHWNSAYDVYWKDSNTHIDVYGYYPFGSPSDVNAYPLTIQKDQDKAAAGGNLGGYEASDFLWGKVTDVAPTEKAIRLPLRHCLSNIRVTLKEGEGFAEGEWVNLEKDILVQNTVREGTVNLADGSVTLTTSEVPETDIIPSRRTDEFRAIVLPQKMGANVPLFSITVDGVVYSYAKPEGLEYIQGKMHTFTIQVNKKSMTGEYEFKLISESITPWEADLVSHDATAKEYIIIDSKAGKLKEAIQAANKDFRKLQNLKITGEINPNDFYFMRDSMSVLQSLNLKEVILKGEEDGVIPENALLKKTSLLRLVLPDKIKKIKKSAFHGCTNLSGSLIIPEGVTHIESGAFAYCKSFTGTLTLPSTLESINGNYITNEMGAFFECGFVCELKFPDKLTYLGDNAFQNCTGLYGNLVLPHNLQYLGESAFEQCKNLSENISIPQTLTEIKYRTFAYCRFDGTLELHDGITAIGEEAFCGNSLKGELLLPKNLSVISNGTFDGCDFSGELKLPTQLTVIGNNAFKNNWRLMGILEIPQNVQTIGAGAFANCRSLEGVIFPEALENIRYEATLGDEGGAFSNCFGIGSIVCKGTIPPYVQPGAFNGVAKDNFTLEVPESAIPLYQAEPGWSDFKRIAAHRELVCRPALATAINTQCTRTLVIDAEGDWIVESKPEWCELSQTEGSKKTELTLTFQQMPAGNNREGEIVFKLKDQDYTTKCKLTQYDYSYGEDEIITLQTAKRGKGINLVFLGDGFNAEDISKGEYLKAMKEQVENFFGIEPYTTYRDYFNVYTAIAVSPESGIGAVNTIVYTRFNTTFTGGVGLRCDYEDVFKYALQMPTVTKDNLNQSLIIITPNTTDYGGICQMWDDGSAIAFCPMSNYGYPLDTRGVIQHEAGGHGFGKLGDEYIYHNEFIDFCTCTCCGHVYEFNHAKGNGWYDNLSLTGKMHEVPWSHLIFHERYSEVVDVFEGGYMHNRGVFRSEQNSCMNNDIPYYSTISRESIVRRIKAYAGETYSFEDFVANDKLSAATASRSLDVSPFVESRMHSVHHTPQIHKGSPLK